MVYNSSLELSTAGPIFFNPQLSNIDYLLFIPIDKNNTGDPINLLFVMDNLIFSAYCNDNNSCTNDTFNPSLLSCSYQMKECPDDGDPCTSYSCDSSSGDCVVSYDRCDDSDGCTLDFCVPGVGCRNDLFCQSTPCIEATCTSDRACLKRNITCDGKKKI